MLFFYGIKASFKNRVIYRDELIEKLPGKEYDGLDRTVDLRISRLRRKIESVSSAPQLIHSVRGEGYCLTMNPQSEGRG
ncbi:MAG: hypothetical protein GF307_03150 [candidate division Zixibacteria bacterium]|nr:hypothetical protein [candidate division Zixibacteria bacterium]